jgi:hypothetical protein
VNRNVSAVDQHGIGYNEEVTGWDVQLLLLWPMLSRPLGFVQAQYPISLNDKQQQSVCQFCLVAPWWSSGLVLAHAPEWGWRKRWMIDFVLIFYLFFRVRNLCIYLIVVFYHSNRKPLINLSFHKFTKINSHFLPESNRLIDSFIQPL